MINLVATNTVQDWMWVLEGVTYSTWIRSWLVDTDFSGVVRNCWWRRPYAL